ncbi:hypothetical protein QQ045_032313 [Rhodiola kirilowii]
MDHIMKLLEEDEDEKMHFSKADVDALTAALKRDVTEGNSSASEPAGAMMSQGMNHSQQWPISNPHGNPNQQSQLEKSSFTREDHVSSEQKQSLPGSDNQQHKVDASCTQEVDRSPFQLKQADAIEQSTLQCSKPSQLLIPENNANLVQESCITLNSEREVQLPVRQHMTQEATILEQGSDAVNEGTQVPFALLLPLITPQLDKESATGLNSLYVKLKKNEIPKIAFIRLMRCIVDDQMLKTAFSKRLAQVSIAQFIISYDVSSSLHTIFFIPCQVKVRNSQGATNKGQHEHQQEKAISQKVQHEHQQDPHGMQQDQMVSSSLNPFSQEREQYWFTRPQRHTKQQKQHLHSGLFPRYGSSSGNINQHSGVSNTSSMSVEPQCHPLVSPASFNQNTNSNQPASGIGTTKFDRAYPVTDANRMHADSSPHMTVVQHQSSPLESETTSDHSTSTSLQQEPKDLGTEQQQRPQSITTCNMSSGSFNLGTVPGGSKQDALDKEAGMIGFRASRFPAYFVTPALSVHQVSQMSNRRMPAVQLSGNIERGVLNKTFIGQKKPLETLSQPLSSKKRKVSGGFLKRTIEQLNDVTAISGVDVREEEKNLFSGSKEESRVSETSRRVVQEEEARLILQRVPLQKKLEGIMLKCGVRSISNDVEQCLSLCVEERMRGLIRNLIRVSKQRIDIMKQKHQTTITSVVRQQILLMNRKCREELEKKKTESEKMWNLIEPESNPATDGEKEKEGIRKASKANIEEICKMRTTAANVAARAAVGGR